MIFPKGEQLAKTVLAFANTAGGKLVNGVNDERQLVGLQQLDVFVFELMDKGGPPSFYNTALRYFFRVCFIG